MDTKPIAWACAIRNTNYMGSVSSSIKRFSSIVPTIRMEYPKYKVKAQDFFKLDIEPYRGYSIIGWCFNKYHANAEEITKYLEAEIHKIIIGKLDQAHRTIVSYSADYSKDMTIEEFEEHIRAFELIDIRINLPKDMLIPRYKEMNPSNGVTLISKWIERIVRPRVMEAAINIVDTDHSSRETLSSLRRKYCDRIHKTTNIHKMEETK